MGQQVLAVLANVNNNALRTPFPKIFVASNILQGVQGNEWMLCGAPSQYLAEARAVVHNMSAQVASDQGALSIIESLDSNIETQ